MAYIKNTDPWMRHAIEIIKADDSVDVSLEAKNKDLLKFGRNRDVETAKTTLMTLPDGTDNETYVSSNLITSIISTAAGDTESVTVEGHTISGSDFTFVTQTLNLTGTSAATLATPLARCSRVYNNDSTVLSGTISVTEDDTYTAGVPDTDSKVHLQIFAGQQNSNKCATTLSSIDYWVITHAYAHMLSKNSSSFAEVILEIRLSGKVFREVETFACSSGLPGHIQFEPYIIVPPNADVRLRAVSDSATGRDVAGSIHGALLTT